MLFQLDDGSYQITQDGELTSILGVSGHLLLLTEIALLFKDADVPRFDYEQVQLLGSSSGVVKDYCRPTRIDAISSERIGGIRYEGSRVWCYNGETLFVSPDLAEVLARRYPDVECSVGFEWFA